MKREREEKREESEPFFQVVLLAQTVDVLGQQAQLVPGRALQVGGQELEGGQGVEEGLGGALEVREQRHVGLEQFGALDERVHLVEWGVVVRVEDLGDQLGRVPREQRQVGGGVGGRDRTFLLLSSLPFLLFLLILLFLLALLKSSSLPSSSSASRLLVAFVQTVGFFCDRNDEHSCDLYEET